MSTSKQREPFLTHYRTNILSKLREIDLFIKTQPAPYSKESVLKILNMPSSEFDKITSELGIGCITPFSLVLIMKNGSGELCTAFRRQLECGLTDTYSPEQISYIYNIDISIVLKAFSDMGVTILHKGLLETLFSNIHI